MKEWASKAGFAAGRRSHALYEWTALMSCIVIAAVILGCANDMTPEEAGLYIREGQSLTRVPLTSLADPGTPPILSRSAELVSYSATAEKFMVLDAKGYNGRTHPSSYAKRYQVAVTMTPLPSKAGVYVAIAPPEGWKSGTFLILDSQTMNTYPLDKPARGYVLRVE